MKDTADWLEAELARIDRDRAEAHRFADQSRKQMAKRDRLEAQYGWSRLPLAVLFTVVCSAVIGILISLPEYLRLFWFGTR